MTRLRINLLPFISLVILALVLSVIALPAHAETDEYSVKAAFIFNFIRFVNLPSASSANSDAPIAICVLGDAPLGDPLRRLTGKIVKGRPITARHIRTIEECRNCSVLFISKSEDWRLPQALRAVNGAGTLTIGDSEGFAKSGIMINFYIEDGKVRFEINIKSAERAGIKISSELLKLSRIVK